MKTPVNIRVNQTGVVVGPNLQALNRRLNQEVVQNPDWETVIAGMRGAMTTVARFIDPNATASLDFRLVSDGSQVRVLIDLTATGI
jgi:hypothetical protein